MFYAHMGTKLNDKVLYVSTAKSDVDERSGQTVDDLMLIINEVRAEIIQFEMAGFPQKGTPVGHKNLFAHVRKFVRLTSVKS